MFKSGATTRRALSNTLGWDAGVLKLRRTFRRQFTATGAYAYVGGQCHSGAIVVSFRAYLPLVIK